MTRLIRLFAFAVLMVLQAASLAAQDQGGVDILLSKARSLESRGRMDLAAQNWKQVLLVNPNQLRDFFQFAEDLPLSGFSVTIPHKRRIMRYLDYVDPLAKRIGAVNTVVRKAGKWRGSNTDAEAVSG